MSRALTKALYLSRVLAIGVLTLIWTGSAMAPSAAQPGDAANSVSLGSQESVRAYDIDAQALVTISFDDASQTVYDAAFPILESHGIPATYYFITSYLTEPWKAQLKDLENHGWEIGSHSRTHPHLEGLDPASLVTELSQSKADLEAAGLAVSGFAYPYGTGYRDGAVLREVKRHYSYARSVRTGLNTPIIEQYALKAQTVTNSTAMGTMKGWIDQAIADRRWLVLLMHTVDETGSEYSIAPADLSELASYIQAQVDTGQVNAVTVREGVDRCTEPHWNPIHDPGYAVQGDLAVTNGRVLWHFGPDITTYLHDGYAWVESGKTRYYEWNGQYRTLRVASDIALQSISAERVTVQFALNSTDGKASVLSTVTLVPGSPLAEVNITAIQGTPTTLSLGQDLARRFSVDEGALVTDGSLETGMRAYGGSAQSFFAFDSTTDLIRIVTHSGLKSHSEYADYMNGEFRSNPISRASELPYTWYVGGTRFDTFSLLSEAEAGTLNGGSTFYTGGDASPKTGHTGVVLDGSQETVTIPFTLPVTGTFTLSIRQKGTSASDQYSYQIDGGEKFTRAVTGTTFGYENVTLKDLSATGHTLTVGQVSGTVDVDYALLVPISRSPGTPATIEFPADVARQAFNRVFLPLILFDSHP